MLSVWKPQQHHLFSFMSFWVDRAQLADPSAPLVLAGPLSSGLGRWVWFTHLAGSGAGSCLGAQQGYQAEFPGFPCRGFSRWIGLLKQK